MGKVTYTEETLITAMNKCNNISAVCRKIGVSVTSGGSRSRIVKIFKRINPSWIGFSYNVLFPTHGGGCAKKNATEILIKLPEGSRRRQSKQLRRAMVEVGIPYICSVCGLDAVWNKKELKLEIEHMDGNCLNNRAENLTFLCPNCHSQVLINYPWQT